MIIQICVGSSCHLHGSEDIVNLIRKAIADHKLEAEVTLAGCFCTGKCNRNGVTVVVDDEIYTEITRETFKDFFNEKVLSAFNS